MISFPASDSGAGLRAHPDLIAALLLGAIAVGLWFSGHMALTVLLLIAATLISLWQPVGGFWAVCAAIPLVMHPVAVGDSHFTLLELGILMAFGGVAMRTLTRQPVRSLIDRLRIEPNLIVWFGGAALVIFAAISIAWMPETAHRDVALRNARWVVVEPLMVFVVARYTIRVRGGRALVYGLAIPAAVASVVAIGEMLEGGAFRADGVTRATSPYLHPNNLALYLERVLVLFGGLIIFRTIPLHWRNTGLLLAIGVGLVATFSRGMAPAVTAGLLVLGLVIGNRRIVAGSLTALAIGLALLAVFASDRLGGDSIDGFVGERRYIWRAATSMIADYPVSGIGLDQFLYHHAPRYIAPEAWSERYISHPHNIVFDSWLSLGAPGLLLLIGGSITLALTIRSLIRSGTAVDAVQAAAVAALVTGLVHGLVDNGYFLPDLAVLTWILIALASTIASGAPENRTIQPASPGDRT